MSLITKPIDRRELLKTLVKYLPFTYKTSMSESELVKAEKPLAELPEELTEPSGSKEVVNWASFVSRCGDDGMVKDIVKAFLEDSMRSIEIIADAIEDENSENVKTYAHWMRSSAWYVASDRLYESASRLEGAGNEKDMIIAASLLGQGRDEFEKAS